ncbi:hypothetical protein [Sulfidibacter corallicola]|uniref:Uncharacterized protein n=1 Tax=Sulfidibacter corallicola TaxID=2818388 RepID=A0A8A4TL37_SULCO|nr:hypothetical protein [Sulfidibacter corallicola]QTD50719.1 hypothetical protein J3U87_34465 [Sulfidibacter corallicola]
MTLKRLEAGDRLPWVRADTMQAIFDELAFTETERAITETHIRSTRQLVTLTKAYDRVLSTPGHYLMPENDRWLNLDRI